MRDGPTSPDDEFFFDAATAARVMGRGVDVGCLLAAASVETERETCTVLARSGMGTDACSAGRHVQ
jgi:hypothetical protein